MFEHRSNSPHTNAQSDLLGMQAWHCNGKILSEAPTSSGGRFFVLSSSGRLVLTMSNFSNYGIFGATLANLIFRRMSPLSKGRGHRRAGLRSTLPPQMH